MERANSLSAQSYFNNVFYYDYNGPYYALFREPYAMDAKTSGFAGFVQDNWTLNDRVTFNLGIRFDHNTGSIPDVDQPDSALEGTTGVTFPGLGEIISFNDVSPRLGSHRDPGRGGEDRCEGELGAVLRQASRRTCSATHRTGTPVSTRSSSTPTPGRTTIPYYSVDPNISYGIDPDLGNQYTDQFYVGLEREIMPDLGLEFSYIHKQEKNFIRVDDVRGEYAQIPFVDTFRGQTQTLQVFNRISPSSQSLFQVTNRDDFDHNYDSFNVQAYKRFSQNWQLQGSYQWQKGEGYTSGSLGIGAQSFSGLGTRAFGRDPNDLINAFGTASHGQHQQRPALRHLRRSERISHRRSLLVRVGPSVCQGHQRDRPQPGGSTGAGRAAGFVLPSDGERVPDPYRQRLRLRIRRTAPAAFGRHLQSVQCRYLHRRAQ